METIDVSQVVVGERARKDLGDLTELKESMATLGQLQPIGLAPGNDLLFGGRRLAAAKALGWTEILAVRPLTREDAATLLEAERDENTCRKPMTVGELVALGRRIMAVGAEERKAAKLEGNRRGAEATNSGLPSAEGKPTKEEYRQRSGTYIAARGVGISEATYARANALVSAAEDPEDPAHDTAVASLAEAEAGEISITQAYTRVLRDRKAAKGEVSPDTARQERAASDRRRKAVDHLEMFERMVASLSGLTAVVDEIETVTETVTPEEATRLLGDLSSSIRSLNRLRSLLKERAA